MTDWYGLNEWLLGEVFEFSNGDLDPTVCPINVPSANQLKTLVEIHGWEAFGAVVKTVMAEKKLRRLVDCGVPFIEASKIAGLSQAHHKH